MSWKALSAHVQGEGEIPPLPEIRNSKWRKACWGWGVGSGSLPALRQLPYAHPTPFRNDDGALFLQRSGVWTQETYGGWECDSGELSVPREHPVLRQGWAKHLRSSADHPLGSPGSVGRKGWCTAGPASSVVGVPSWTTVLKEAMEVMPRWSSLDRKASSARSLTLCFHIPFVST